MSYAGPLWKVCSGFGRWDPDAARYLGICETELLDVCATRVSWCTARRVRLMQQHSKGDQSRYAPSQWETSLHCNYVSHWLGTYLNWSLSNPWCWRPQGNSVWHGKYKYCQCPRGRVWAPITLVCNLRHLSLTWTSTIFDARHQWWEARVKMFECWKNIDNINSM